MITYDRFSYQVTHRFNRPWGCEVRVAIYDRLSQKHIASPSIMRTSKSESDDITHFIQSLSNIIDFPEKVDPILFESDITKLLRSKKFLLADETLKDLKDLNTLKDGV